MGARRTWADCSAQTWSPVEVGELISTRSGDVEKGTIWRDFVFQRPFRFYVMTHDTERHSSIRIFNVDSVSYKFQPCLTHIPSLLLLSSLLSRWPWLTGLSNARYYLIPTNLSTSPSNAHSHMKNFERTGGQTVLFHWHHSRLGRTNLGRCQIDGSTCWELVSWFSTHTDPLFCLQDNSKTNMADSWSKDVLSRQLWHSPRPQSNLRYRQ